MAETLGRLLNWLVRKIGPGALVGFSLLLVLLSSVVWWLNHFAGRFASPSLGGTTFLALLLGWLLARSRLSGWLAAVLLALAGLFSVFALAGDLLAPLLALLRAALSLSGLVRAWQPGWPLPDPSLTLLLAQDLGLRLADLAQRLGLWINGMLRGVPGFDPLAAGLVWGVLLWEAAAWAAWGVRRNGRPLPAALPAVAILAASLAFARAQLLYLLPAFAAVLGLLAWSQYARRQHTWQRQGIDYASDIPFDLSLWTGAIVVVVTGLALLAATPSPHQAVRYARSLLLPRSQAAENLGQSLGLAPGVGQVASGVAGGVLPRQHLLGSGPELSQQVVFLASAPGDAPYYWRAAAYDRYDGRGWSTSPTSAVAFPAGAALAPSAQPGAYRWVEQRIEVLGDLGLQVLQAGELARLDQPYELDLRPAPAGELDVFGARLQRPPTGGDYRAVSWLLVPSEADLAAAGYDYPLWLAARYLVLPSSLPSRVADLARQVVAGAATPYERARLIEAYLRALPYTLDVPAPPSGRDVVDYYLFDLRRGYCDYAASAMVVLSRLVGLPARLVIGYAPGRYDPASGRTLVTEAEAHSWPEIYFSGVGWVAFEPTGGRSLVALPDAPLSPAPLEPPALAPASARALPAEPLGLVLAGLALLLLFFLAWLGWRAGRRHSARALVAAYAGLRRLGRGLGVPDSPGLTPAEVAAALGLRVEQLARPGRWAAALHPAGEEAQRLAELYARLIYSPHPPGVAEASAAQRIWRRLRWRLWLVRLARRRSSD